MARDLNYNVGVSVSGADDLATVADDLETVATKTDDLDGSSATVDVEAPGAEEAATNVGTLSDELRDIPVVGDTLANIAGKLGDIGGAGESAAGSISKILGGVGGFALIGGAVNLATQAWGFYSKRAEEAARKAEELAEAHRDVSDALAEGDVTAAASQFTDIYGDAIDQANEAGLAIDEVTQFITGQANEVPSLGAAYDALAPSVADTEKAIRDLEDPTLEQVQAMRAAAQADELMRMGLDETADALADSRHQYAEQGDVLTTNEEQLGQVAAGLTAAADAEGEMAAGAAGSTEQLEAQRQQLEEAKQGAIDYATAIGSVDFQAAELEGATTAMSAYSANLFALPNAVQASEEAFGALNEAIGDSAVNFDVTTEAGRAQQDALEGVAKVIDTELAQAYDNANGSQAAFMASAEETRTQVLGKLQNDLGLTATEAEEVAAALGLTTGEFEARYNMAGAEEARLQLELLGGAIEGLPDDVEARVNTLIVQGDYVGARDEVQKYYETNPILTTAEIDAAGFKANAEDVVDFVPTAIFPTGADTDDAEAEMEATADAAPDATITTGADTAPASEQIFDTADANYQATIVGEGNTSPAESDLLATQTTYREAVIIGKAETFSADLALINTARHRDATITAVAHTGAAEAALNSTARTRHSTIVVHTVGGGGSSRSGGGRSAAVASAATATTTAAAPAAYSTAPGPVNVTINTAVIGDRYDVQRVVSRAVRGAVRIGGSRPAA